MPNNQKGLIQLIPLVILVVGLVVGVYLVGEQTNLLPKAAETPQSTNLFNKVKDIEAKSEKIDQDQIVGDKNVDLPVVVFEDLNKNGIKDNGEVGIPNIPVEVKAFYKSTELENKEKFYYDASDATAITNSNGEITWIIPGGGTVVDRESSANFYIELYWVYVSAYRFDTSAHGGGLPPVGWMHSNDDYLLQKSYSDNPFPGEASLQIVTSAENILEPAYLPLIGAQKITGQIFNDKNRNGVRDGDEFASDQVFGGVNILVDATKANNATRKFYWSVSNPDGSYEINDLPPLSQYRIKATPACPFAATSQTQSGSTLGLAGNVKYDFGVIFDENDPCISN